MSDFSDWLSFVSSVGGISFLMLALSEVILSAMAGDGAVVDGMAGTMVIAGEA